MQNVLCTNLAVTKRTFNEVDAFGVKSSFISITMVVMNEEREQVP